MTRIALPHDQPHRPESRLLNRFCFVLPVLSVALQGAALKAVMPQFDMGSNLILYLGVQYLLALLISTVLATRATAPRLRHAAYWFALGSLWMPHICTVVGIGVALLVASL